MSALEPLVVNFASVTLNSLMCRSERARRSALPWWPMKVPAFHSTRRMCSSPLDVQTLSKVALRRVVRSSVVASLSKGTAL